MYIFSPVLFTSLVCKLTHSAVLPRLLLALGDFNVVGVSEMVYAVYSKDFLSWLTALILDLVAVIKYWC